MESFASLRSQCAYDVGKNIDRRALQNLNAILKTDPPSFGWVPSLIESLTVCALAFRLDRAGRFDVLRAEILLAREKVPRWQKEIARAVVALEDILQEANYQGSLHEYLQLRFPASVDPDVLSLQAEFGSKPSSSYEQLTTRCYGDLKQLAAMLENGRRNAEELSGKQGPTPDIYGRMLFRATAEAWVMAKGRLPPVSSNGPFHKFLERIGEILPSDVRDSILPLNQETVRDWLRKQRAIQNRGR